MSAASIKRGGKSRAARAKPATARPRVKRASRLDRIIRASPLSPVQLQRLVTLAIVALVATAGIVIANLAGLPALAQQQWSLLAGQAGFEVKRVEVTGIDRVDELKVYDIVLAEKDRAMPQVDIARIRRDLLQYGWIEDARVSRRLPDTLVVEIVERKPAALWENGGQLSLIDAKGVVLEQITGDAPTGLTRIAGPQANLRTVALAELLDKAPALKPQVTGARWVGNRRWDLEFRTGETLALPEGQDASEKALLNFARMDGVSRLLGKDIIHFDMRDPDRAYLRRAPKAADPARVADANTEG